MSVRVLNDLIVPDAPICYGILKPGKGVDGGVPVVKVKDYDGGSISTDGLLLTSPAIDRQYARSRLRAGDILLSIRGTAGRVAIVPPELDGANITQDTARIRVPADERRFVYHALRSDAVQTQIQLNTVGQAVKGINIASVRQLELPWPEERVRRQIAYLADLCDLRSALTEQLIAAKRELRRGLMKDLLTGKWRFPEFARETWRHRPLSDFFVEKSVRNRAGIELVLSCSKLYGVIPQRERFGKRLASANLSNYKVVCPGDLVYDPMLLWDGSIGFVTESERGVVSPAYATFTFNDEAGSRAFFAQALFTYRAKHLYRSISRGTNVRRKKAIPGEFLSLQVPVPATREEQERIGEFFAGIDREINSLAELRRWIDRYKRGLVQSLLSGEIDLPDDADATESVYA